LPLDKISPPSQKKEIGLTPLGVATLKT